MRWWSTFNVLHLMLFLKLHTIIPKLIKLVTAGEILVVLITSWVGYGSKGPQRISVYSIGMEVRKLTTGIIASSMPEKMTVENDRG